MVRIQSLAPSYSHLKFGDATQTMHCPLAMTSMDRTPDCVSFTYEFPHWVKLCPSILFGEGTHFYFEVSADIL